MGLFDRMFRQPATAGVLPAENLATEVIAYLLEEHEPFRSKFLNRCGVEASNGDWEVATQVKLIAPGERWHQKIPDLVLQRRAGHGREIDTMVIVEVKIDAGPTLSEMEDGKIVSQTELYGEYLQHEKNHGRLRDRHLATLTRWSPENWLKSDHPLRFTQVAKWLEETGETSATSPSPAVAFLGLQWAEFLKQRRWAMVELSAQHLDAIGSMRELTDQLRDVAQAATSKAVVPTGPWNWQPHSRRSVSASLPQGLAVWALPLTRHDERIGFVQVGCVYGAANGQAFIRAIVAVSKQCPDLSGIGFPVEDIIHNWGILLDDVAPLIRAGTPSTDVTDAMERQIGAVLEELARLQ